MERKAKDKRGEGKKYRKDNLAVEERTRKIREHSVELSQEMGKISPRWWGSAKIS